MPRGIFKNPNLRSERISKRLIGRKLSESHVENFRRSQTGKIGPLSKNWKGGISKDKEYRKKWNKDRYLKIKGDPEAYSIVNKKKIDARLRKKEQLAGSNRPTLCDICKQVGKICFDHNHENGEFRGWICHSCNLALGLIRDNKDTLKAMLKYLER